MESGRPCCAQALRDRLPLASGVSCLRTSVLHWMCGHRVLVPLVPNWNWK